MIDKDFEKSDLLRKFNIKTAIRTEIGSEMFPQFSFHASELDDIRRKLGLNNRFLTEVVLQPLKELLAMTEMS